MYIWLFCTYILLFNLIMWAVCSTIKIKISFVYQQRLLCVFLKITVVSLRGNEWVVRKLHTLHKPTPDFAPWPGIRRANPSVSGVCFCLFFVCFLFCFGLGFLVQ